MNVLCVQVDKCEQQQHEDLRVSSKKMRQEQEKELKSFRYCNSYFWQGKIEISNKLRNKRVDPAL